MKAQRPYLLRALYEWIVDSDDVPYVLVQADLDGVVVPTEHVEDGQIVLNIGPNAVRDLALGDEYVMCSSRFNGRAFELILPIAAIKAIYGRESGEGMVFPPDTLKGAGTAELTSASPDVAAEPQPEADKDGGPDDKDDKGGRPGLRLV